MPVLPVPSEPGPAGVLWGRTILCGSPPLQPRGQSRGCQGWRWLPSCYRKLFSRAWKGWILRRESAPTPPYWAAGSLFSCAAPICPASLFLCPGPSGHPCELPGLQNPFTDQPLIGDVADFSFVSTVRASNMAPSGPRLDAGLTPCRLQAGHLWRACLGNRSPSLSSLPRVQVLQAAGAPSFHSAEISGASGAPGSLVWLRDCLLGFRPHPPPVTQLSCGVMAGPWLGSQGWG